MKCIICEKEFNCTKRGNYWLGENYCNRLKNCVCMNCWIEDGYKKKVDMSKEMKDLIICYSSRKNILKELIERRISK